MPCPPEAYTSAAFLQTEQEQVFGKERVRVGRSSALANAGDYVTLDLAEQPVVVLRDHQGILRALSNVCLHRMSTLLEGRGNTRKIVCPYHAWTYLLDGALLGAPAMTRNSGFCKEDHALPPLRCEEWQGWVFVSLNPQVASVAEKLSGVLPLIADYNMVKYTETFFETHVWDTNWKILAENFMESYHLPVCHGGTIGGLSKLDEMICPPGQAAYNYHTILKDDGLPIALAHPANTTLKGDARRTMFLLAIYPSLMITLTPGYFWYLTLLPKGTGQVQIGYGGGMSPDYVNDPQAEKHFKQLKTLLDEVNAEDKGGTEKMYRGCCQNWQSPGICHIWSGQISSLPSI